MPENLILANCSNISLYCNHNAYLVGREYFQLIDLITYNKICGYMVFTVKAY
jgi:hypothetical protein